MTSQRHQNNQINMHGKLINARRHSIAHFDDSNNYAMTEKPRESSENDKKKQKTGFQFIESI
jgi:hypothetical protein